ncbi:MAG: hypothetical protein ACRYFU_04380 [Janthinobacterium lividum]
MARRLRFSAPLACTLLFASVSAPTYASAQDAATPETSTGAAKQEKKAGSRKDHPLTPAQIHNPVLWEDPGNIASKDLFLGRGGADHQPRPPFTFVSEDHNGTNPKFDARDANDKKWRVKLGSESRPEVVASRLLWAVGYFTDEDYLLPTASVANLQMKRGKELVHDDQVTDARFNRKPGGEKTIADWRWKGNPFTDKREFNGLRVMMAVMNNWDLKDVNNAVYSDDKHDRQIFLVSDIGATFASNDEHVHHDTDKGNVESFEHSKFIIKKTDKDVSFGTPMLPAGLVLRQGPILLGEAVRRQGLDWIGHDIPITDARWVGGLLGQLTHGQLEDAFRAGNFPEDQREAFVKIVEARISELKTL